MTLSLDTNLKIEAATVPLVATVAEPEPLFRLARAPKPLAETLADVQATADLPLNQARTLPPEVYTDEAFLKWEIDHVLRPGWLCLAHVSQVPKAGDFIKLDLLGEPLVLVRGKDEVVRVLSRVCAHRGADIMPPGYTYEGQRACAEAEGPAGCGHARFFMCPYHFWSFDLTGQLKAAPEMQQAEGFCRENIQLTAFRTEIWHGWVFVNLDGKAAPLATQLAGMAADLAPWQPAEMKVAIYREWDCPFNWKVLVENFMEAYHHLGAHSQTFQPLMPAQDTWAEAERPHHIRVNLPFKQHYTPNPATDFPTIEGLRPDDQQQMSVFLAYPGFMLFTGPDRLFWYRIDPLGPDRSRLVTTMLVPASLAAEPDYAAKIAAADQMLIDFHLEDMRVCTGIQRGLHATGYQRGRLSHLDMPVWLIQRYLAARARGTFPTLDRPAAPAQR